MYVCVICVCIRVYIFWLIEALRDSSDSEEESYEVSTVYLCAICVCVCV
jgi:hypothetical protein